MAMGPAAAASAAIVPARTLRRALATATATVAVADTTGTILPRRRHRRRGTGMTPALRTLFIRWSMLTPVGDRLRLRLLLGTTAMLPCRAVCTITTMGL